MSLTRKHTASWEVKETRKTGEWLHGYGPAYSLSAADITTAERILLGACTGSVGAKPTEKDERDSLPVYGSVFEAGGARAQAEA